jgi:hypothetical protein
VARRPLVSWRARAALVVVCCAWFNLAPAREWHDVAAIGAALVLLWLSFPRAVADRR